MDEIDKRIHLGYLTLFFMNLFYCLVNNNYLLLIYTSFSLFIAYFITYPDSFFLCFDNAKKFIESRRNIHKDTLYNKTKDNDSSNI